ncbi:MAG: 4-hydroxy-tetrahydrodipicolinate reductase [Thermomicrobium sp.]
MLRLALIGLTGRMGRAVAELAATTPDIELVAGLVSPRRDLAEAARLLPRPVRVTHDLSELVSGVDVIIDFSRPEVTADAVLAAADSGVAFVSGTTGLRESEFAALRQAAASIPVVHATNFSIGTAVLLRIVPELAQVLASWDCELIERHHRQKRDAPSGTALTLARAVASARATNAPFVYGRGPGIAVRQPGELGIHAIRAGGEIGRHTLLFASDEEGLEITHWAQSRRAYAAGALEAARRLVGRPPGLYQFTDLLFDM